MLEAVVAGVEEVVVVVALLAAAVAKSLIA